jgi:hypothetical protein
MRVALSCIGWQSGQVKDPTSFCATNCWALARILAYAVLLAIFSLLNVRCWIFFSFQVLLFFFSLGYTSFLVFIFLGYTSIYVVTSQFDGEFSFCSFVIVVFWIMCANYVLTGRALLRSCQLCVSRIW